LVIAMADGLPEKQRRSFVQRQLEILALRSLELADQTAAGQISFLDAIDLAYEAALWAGLPHAIEASGLIDTSIMSGDDVVQVTLAAAFANARRPCDRAAALSGRCHCRSRPCHRRRKEAADPRQPGQTWQDIERRGSKNF
jgi:hypothetical protein